MTLGPVELVVVGFPGSRFSGEIRPRIQDLVERNIVNIVDALLITKSDQGEVTYFEMDEIQDVDPDLRALHACFSAGARPDLARRTARCSRRSWHPAHRLSRSRSSTPG